MANLQRKVILLRPEEDSTARLSQDRAACPRPAGLKGVVKVPSLLFDIELEDTVPEEAPVDEAEDLIVKVEALLKPQSQLEHQLTDEVQRIQSELGSENTKEEASQMARKLRLSGYVFKLRTALGGSCPGSCLRQLRHYFLTCSSTASPQTVSCVVDPQFREQFEIANPTRRYIKLLAQLPEVVVLTEERLQNLVTLLSQEMQQSFQVSGSTLPPWRQSASMMSKWRPRRSEDTVVNPTSPISSSHRTLSEFKAGKVIIPRLDTFGLPKEKSGKELAEAKRGNVRTEFPISPARDKAVALSAKRGRDPGVHTGFSSLLASKLRGVASVEGDERLSAAWYTGRGQA